MGLYISSGYAKWVWKWFLKIREVNKKMFFDYEVDRKNTKAAIKFRYFIDDDERYREAITTRHFGKDATNIFDVSFEFGCWEMFLMAEEDFIIKWKSETCRIDYITKENRHYVLIAEAINNRICASISRVSRHRLEPISQVQDTYDECPHDKVMAIMKRLKEMADGYSCMEAKCEDPLDWYVFVDEYGSWKVATPFSMMPYSFCSILLNTDGTEEDVMESVNRIYKKNETRYARIFADLKAYREKPVSKYYF